MPPRARAPLVARLATTLARSANDRGSPGAYRCSEIGGSKANIPIQKINQAYERLAKGDVKYRFVIDMASLK